MQTDTSYNYTISSRKVTLKLFFLLLLQNLFWMNCILLSQKQKTKERTPA